MSGNAIITGASSGLGLEIAKALAADGYNLVVTGRNQAKLDAAVTAINAGAGGDPAQGFTLDIGDFDAVREFAKTMDERFTQIDLLVLNAGLYTRRLHRLPNGFEAMIGVMHLGHFLLTHRLLDKVLAAPAARVVLTSSVMHRIAKINLDSFTDPKRHRIGLVAYGQAKLANLMFARELARRYGDRGLIAHAFHPGAVATGVWRELPKPIPWLADKLMVSPPQGADTGIWLATADEPTHSNGEYFQNRKVARSSAASRDAELGAQLWQASERYCGLA